MSRIPIAIATITPTTDLDILAEAWAAQVAAAIHAANIEARRCPTCRTPLPEDAHPRRVYCDVDCRANRRHG